MFFVWVFVVTPSSMGKVLRGKQTISFATKNKAKRRLIYFGLMAGAISQIAFLYYLVQRFSIKLPNLGVFIYLSTNISTLLIPFFNMWKSKIHEALVFYYFAANPLSLLLIGLTIRSQFPTLFIISLLVFLAYFIIVVRLIVIHKMRSASMERWAFLMLSIWTLFMTFYI